MQATDVAARFLDALERRDFDAIAATFANDGRLRGLVPPGLREADDHDAIAERFRIWFGETEDFALVDSSAEALADVVKIRWRVAGTQPEIGRFVLEQTAYARAGDGGFEWMNLVCSGHRPVVA